MEKFWMVYLGGQRAPTFRHPSKERAHVEAARLVTEHGGVAFILEATEMIQNIGITTTKLADPPPNPEDIPF